MKKINTGTFVLLLFLFTSCHGQNKAMEDQKKAFEAIGVHTPQGMKPGSRIYMKATINGKAWEANDLMPDEDGSSLYHVNGEKDEIRIAFYISNSNGIKAGDTKKFSENNAVDFFYPDETGIYGGRTGSYTITKVDNDGFEASFQFTAGSVRSTSNVYEVTNGTLRFPFAKRR